MRAIRDSAIRPVSGMMIEDIVQDRIRMLNEAIEAFLTFCEAQADE